MLGNGYEKYLQQCTVDAFLAAVRLKCIVESFQIRAYFRHSQSHRASCYSRGKWVQTNSTAGPII